MLVYYNFTVNNSLKLSCLIVRIRSVKVWQNCCYRCYSGSFPKIKSKIAIWYQNQFSTNKSYLRQLYKFTISVFKRYHFVYPTAHKRDHKQTPGKMSTCHARGTMWVSAVTYVPGVQSAERDHGTYASGDWGEVGTRMRGRKWVHKMVTDVLFVDKQSCMYIFESIECVGRWYL